MKKLFVLFAALAALAAIVAGSAFSAPPVTTCIQPGDPAALGYQTVNGALNVPAGQVCKFIGHITGNVTVQPGALFKIFGSTIDGNVYVNGGHFQADNYPSLIKGNLNISGSDGSDTNGIWTPYGDTHINGSINYDGNATGLFFQDGTAPDGHPYQTFIGGSINLTNGSPAPTGGPWTIHAPTV
jgi:hypothetical protein